MCRLEHCSLADILDICQQSRDYFETNPIGFGFHISSFPKGWCGDASRYLKRRLHEQLGIDFIYHSGSMRPSESTNTYNHAWLERDNLIIDITADQFNFLGFTNDPITITTDRTFHDLFHHNRKSE